MAGFGLIVGGALEGFGKGQVEAAKAKREAALEQLREQNADRRMRMSQEFQASENAKSREANAASDASQREFTASENEKTRASSGGDYGTAEDGTSLFIKGGKATTVTDAAGKPVKLLAKASDTPAEVATMEYLIRNGAATDVQDAWRQVRQAKADPEKSRAGIYKMWVTALTADGSIPQDQIQQEAMKRTDEALSMLDPEEPSVPMSTDRTAPAGPSSVTPAKPGELRAPAGEGSKERPFKAAKQADIDWFKKFAKPGQIIETPDGQFTK